MLGDELADENEVVAGDDTVAVAQRPLHARHGSSDESGTRAGGIASYLIDLDVPLP